MNLIYFILAESSGDSSIKLIFGGIVVVIWIIGGVLSQMKKKADRERWNNPQPQQDWSHLLRDLTAGQSRPFTPSTPAPPLPPPLPQQPPQQQVQIRQRMQQPKSFAQQSPRPFVQQYSQQRSPQYPQRPLPPRRPGAKPPGAKPFQGPRQIQPKPKSQRRPPAIPAKAVQVSSLATQQSQGGIQDAIISMGPIQGQDGAIGVQSATNASRHTAGPRLTSLQLRKLIFWSEVLAPPLALREMSPK